MEKIIRMDCDRSRFLKRLGYDYFRHPTSPVYVRDGCTIEEFRKTARPGIFLLFTAAKKRTHGFNGNCVYITVMDQGVLRYQDDAFLQRELIAAQRILRFDKAYYQS